MTRLIIKGNRFQAAQAAAERGFSFVFEHETDIPVSTVGVTPINDVGQLNKWVCEDKTAPFPVGSLLLWTPVR
jgi:hypothetical protein